MIQRKKSSNGPEGLSAGRSCGGPAGSSPGNKARTDYRRYRLSLRDWLFYGGGGAAFCALTAYTFYRSFAAFLLLLPLGAVVYPLYQRQALCSSRKRKLQLQFKDGIGMLSSFLGAGYSVENAFSASAAELRNLYGEEAMITKEFMQISADIRLNKPVEALLSDFGRRSGLEDAANFAEVFRIAKRSGGELCSIIAHTAEVIREKTSVSEEINMLTASRRFEQRIMNLMPFGIILYIDLSSAGFFDVMYLTVLGRGIMTACLLGYVGAWVLSDRILDISL